MEDWHDSAFRTLGEWHPTEVSIIGLLIKDRYGRLLLQFRDDFPEVHRGGQWSLFGGHIEDGERKIEAIMRETYEEIGVKLAPENLLPFTKGISFETGNRVYTVHSTQSIEPLQITLGEGAGFAFFSSSQLHKLDIIPAMKTFIFDFASYGDGQ